MSILDDNTAQNMGANDGLRVNSNMKQSWMVTSKWAMFFAILGFIQIAISLLMIGTMGTMLDMVMSMGQADDTGLLLFRSFLPYMTIIGLLAMGVMFFIHFFHLKFATNIQRAINFTDQTAFEKSWLNLRNHFRIFGILTCVMIGIYLIMFIVMGSLLASNGL